MGPMWLVRAARWVRRPPSWRMILIILSVVALSAVIIGAEQIFGLELAERDMNWRRGPQIKVAE